jgi:hypothetical protein
MAGRAVRWSLVAAFSLAVGHLAWQAWLGPPRVPDYFVTGEGSALAGTDAGARQLYLRRNLYLPQHPQHAWLQVVGRDRLTLHVNGKLVGEQVQDGFDVALVANLTPYLRPGHNVLAVTARQIRIAGAPAVAVKGCYVLDDGSAQWIETDDSWRCRAVFERRAAWWFSPEFDDRHWARARVIPCALRGQLASPPTSLTTASGARWITPAGLENGSAAVSRRFEVDGRPRHAWVRVTATSSFRLAVNGVVVDEQESQLGSTVVVKPARWIYDVTPLVRGGGNVVSLLLTGGAPPLHVRADLEVETGSGERTRVGTDRHWRSRPGLSPDWLAPDPDDLAAWRPCFEESGDLGLPPWLTRSQTVRVTLPFGEEVRRAAGQVVVIAAFALLTLLACGWAERRLSRRGGGAGSPAGAGVVYLALVPATLAVAGAVLATWDPRVASQDVYCGWWLLAAILSVPLQWALLALAARHAPTGRRWVGALVSRAAGPGWVHGLLAVVVVAGFWLRVRDLGTEPLQHDEAVHYRQARGVLLRGFPSFRAHENLPVQYVSTSELVWPGAALASLVFDDERYALRVPQLCWATLTIVLVYAVGRGMFGRLVGLVAAALYAFSPNCIQMADFGRYLSQLQFLALLAVYALWRTVAGTGPLNRRALWVTAVSFIATYLSWEGVALIVPGMILAVLLQRRGRLYELLATPALWAALAVVGMAVLLQYAHRETYLAHLLWYGTGATDASVTAMWRYPGFDPWYFVLASSWSRDTFPALLGLAGAGWLLVGKRARHPALFLVVVFVTSCLTMSLFLSVKSWRYSYFLTPPLIVLTAAAVVAGARRLVRLARQPRAPGWWRGYAYGVGAAAVIAALALGSGMTLQLTRMDKLRISSHGLEASGLNTFKFANLKAAADYVRRRMGPGDVVLSNRSQVVDTYLGRPVDYWPQSKLIFQIALQDGGPQPVHRYNGTPLVADRKSLADLFARHRRLWYIEVPLLHRMSNDGDISSFLRQHMDVVYEDFSVAVLFRGPNHRPADLREENDKALRNARANFLPGDNEPGHEYPPGTP